MNIKKIFTHHHSSPAVSTTNAVWLKIIYAGFVLFAISIIFHIWLFISSGKVGVVSQGANSSVVQIIDRNTLNSILSDYINRQSQKSSQSSADTKLSDPSK